MAPLQKNSIEQFNLHPANHQLTLDDSNTKYLCEGCMTHGTGKRYHCHGCNFNMHEYCYTCPVLLTSFMHTRHPLKRVIHSDHQLEHICNVCRDPVEGVFYRCEICEFDVHPICTQLPETLRHVLHRAHPLRLLNSAEAGTCAVCRGACNASSWRYRCGICKGPDDIHIECVLVPCEKQTTLGITKYVPPSKPHDHHNLGGGNYAYGIPCNWNNNPSTANYTFHPATSSNTTHHHHYYNITQPQPQLQPPIINHGGRIGPVMFELVKALAMGVISTLVFGV